MAAFFLVGGAHKNEWLEWHVGEPLPITVRTDASPYYPRVVTIQADGDELTAIIEGLKEGGYVGG